jgi:hypothetical protein
MLEMKRYMALGVILAMTAASTPVEAQLKGLLRKKAEEAIGKKPEPAKPAPAPAPTSAPAPTPATAEPASPSPTPAATAGRAAAPAAEKKAGSALDVAALPVRQSAVQVLRSQVNLRANGDWDQLPYIPPAATAAAYALGDSARAALVETVGSALKGLVMSAAFLAEHNDFIKSEHQGVDHGIKGVVGIEEAMKKNDLKLLEAIQAREMVAMSVEQVRAVPLDYLKKEFLQELVKWKERAANPKLRDRAKYQKIVAIAQPIEAATDEKFLRGYAVIKSIDFGGPDTEEAVFAMHARVKQEKEQIAYDSHSLRGQLRQQMTTFVAIASKVNFDAPTVEKGGTTMFVNAADERQGALWKACFRAGEASTAAALKLARAWLTEL